MNRAVLPLTPSPQLFRLAMNLMRKLYAIDPSMQIGEIMVFLHVASNQNQELHNLKANCRKPRT
jgi:hypothetical protein